MGVVAGVDSSTQSCKVELRDLDDGSLLGRGSAPHPPAFAPCSEQSPVDWWTAFERAFGIAVTAAGIAADDVTALSVAAQCHGLVALADDDSVIRPAKLWNDTTSAPQLNHLRESIGEQAWIAAVGSLPTAAFTLSKIAWLREVEPAAFDRLARICLPHDWLTRELTGAHVTDRSEASGTGYYSTARGRYLLEYLQLIDPNTEWANAVPRVLGPDDAAGTASTVAARRLGVRPEALVGAGGGDQHAAALGLAVEPGDVVYSIGTSGVVYTVSPDPVFDRTGTVDGVADMAGGYLPLVSTLNAARVTDWAQGILGVDHAGASTMALAAEFGRAPVLAAFFDGERKPNRPDATATLGALTAATTREDIARAAFEGVLMGLVRGQHSMNSAGVATDGRVVITGGGSRSPAYRQILADLTGREVTVADPVDADEATARGAAIQAAAVATGGAVIDVRRAWAPRSHVVAEPAAHSEDTRRELFERYMRVADWDGLDVTSRSSTSGPFARSNGPSPT
ncbi:xylulokinase [Rhodococcus sovatensis]|uniref:FGGY family carbohydrate kinase n=1 Tax=Rhodococcus sovatensis TaxID=1805840 RepID=A0ABZ2PI31_9NOCA